METKNVYMKILKNYIKNLDKEELYLFYILSFIIWMIGFSFRKYNFENWYSFFFSFFLILSLIISGIVFMLRLVYQLEGPPKHPFHLLKYSFYFIILLISSAPFFYLWMLRDVISQLKW